MNLAEINIYPIKSLKGISMDSATVEERGLRYDRRWMLTDAEGMFFTQREFPRMALIEVGIGADALTITADGFGQLEIPLLPETDDMRPVTIWQDVCWAEVFPAVINEWFSDVLETDCQLVYMPDDSRRDVNERFNGGGDVVSFADGYPLLVIGESSLADLNLRLDEQFPMNRFRPNLVVSGADAFAEDNWVRIRVGDAVFRSTKPCARCVITTVDQSRGVIAGKEPLKTLASYRLAKMVMPARLADLGLSDTAVLFGQNLIPENVDGVIRIGDRVEVIDEVKHF